MIKRRRIRETREHLKNRRTTATRKILKENEGFQYKIIFEGIGVGFFAGLVISLFRFFIKHVERIRDMYVDASGHSVLVALLGIGLTLFMLILAAAIVKREPLVSGSGIPQVEAEMKGKLNARWLHVLISRFFGSLFAIGAGLSLGTEGPSIQLGAMVGKGVSRINRRLRVEERLLLTCGAGAGLAAVFGAPLAGATFVLEELHKNLSKGVLLSAMASAITADCVSSYIFGLDPVFEFTVGKGMSLDRLWMVVLLGIILGVFGVFYNKTILFVQNVSDRIKPVTKQIIIPFIMIIVLAVFMPKALGSGEALIEPLGEGTMGIKALLILLLVKYITSAISVGTGLPGGTFLPLLLIGAITGCLFTEIVSPLAGYSEKYIQYFVILGMAGYFSAIVRTPITGIILISEMTGSFSNLLEISMVSLVAYMAADLLKGGALYDLLTERLIETTHGKVKRPNRRNKILIESEVCCGSIMEGKTLHEINLPHGCLVVSVQRDGYEIVPGGQTVLMAGDKLMVLCGEDLVMKVQADLDEKCRTLFNA